jgi:glycosyltransferase involved in cell wall biosynthesis
MLVCQGCPPRQRGGVEGHVAALAAGLARLGHQVLVFAGDEQGSPLTCTSSRSGDVEVVRVTGRRRGDPRLAIRDPYVETRFRETVLSFRPDVVHIHHLLFLSLSLPSMCRQLGVPVVTTVHDFWLLSHDFAIEPQRLHGARRRGLHALHANWRHPRLSRPWRVMSRAKVAQAALLESDVTVVPSRFVHGVVTRAGVPGDAVTALPHGLDVPDPVRGQARSPATTVRLVFAGNLVANKGAHVLLRELALLDANVLARLHLDIWGDSPYPRYLSELQQLAAALPVTLHGAYEPSQLPVIFQSADLLVVPALWHETFSLVVREAFAYGVPALVSDRGALPEAVVDGGGSTFSVDGRGTLAAALRRIVTDPLTLEQWSAGVPHVKRMTTYVGELELVYRQVTASALIGPST